MNLPDGIAGIVRRGTTEAEITADLTRLLAAVGGSAAAQRVHVLTRGDWHIALGVAHQQDRVALSGTGTSVQRIVLDDQHGMAAISGTFAEGYAPHDAAATQFEDGLDMIAGALRGAFSIAFWNNTNATLTLVRDQLGARPLSYCVDTARGQFAFASAAVALLEAGLAKRALDAGSLGVYLFNGFMVSPNTMIRDVSAILPGQALTFEAHSSTVSKRVYWRQPHAGSARVDRSRAEHVAVVRNAFETALKRSANGTDTHGAFLSGGFDSSLIVAAAHGLIGGVDTLSIGLDEREFDESDQARWIAQRYSRTHHVTTLRAEDLDAEIDNVIAAMDQPTHDGFNIYLASRAAREHGMRTMLSGLGGDEVFGGYPDIAWLPSLAQADSVLSHMPERLKATGLKIAGGAPFRIGSAVKLAEMLNHPLRSAFPPNGKFMRNLTAAYQTLYMVFPKWTRDALIAPELQDAQTDYFGLPAEFVHHIDATNADGDVSGSIFRLNTLLFLSERVLRDTYFMTAHHAVDVRAPMIDVDFVNALWSVPISERAGTRDGKPFQLEIMRQYVGTDFPQRRKRGFMLPFDVWMRSGRLASRVAETLNDPAAARAIGLDAAAVASLHRSFINRKLPIPWHSLWSVFVLLRWSALHRISL
jgi:asparagine synthase (glutamine-hydrolysing)